MIEADLASDALVQITAESAPPEGYVITMSAVYRTDSPPGPAGRWFNRPPQTGRCTVAEREGATIRGRDHRARAAAQPFARNDPFAVK